MNERDKRHKSKEDRMNVKILKGRHENGIKNGMDPLGIVTEGRGIKV